MFDGHSTERIGTERIHISVFASCAVPVSISHTHTHIHSLSRIAHTCTEATRHERSRRRLLLSSRLVSASPLFSSLLFFSSSLASQSSALLCSPLGINHSGSWNHHSNPRRVRMQSARRRTRIILLKNGAAASKYCTAPYALDIQIHKLHCIALYCTRPSHHISSRLISSRSRVFAAARHTVVPLVAPLLCPQTSSTNSIILLELFRELISYFTNSSTRNRMIVRRLTWSTQFIFIKPTNFYSYL